MLRTTPAGKLNKLFIGLFIFLVLLGTGIFFYKIYNSEEASSAADWPEYNGGPDRNHYSSLTEIDATNITQLEKAWEYSSGGADTSRNNTQMQCNPIIIDGVLY